MIAAHELGLEREIECVRTTASMLHPNVALLPDNPLSKIPTLILEDGSPLYDSLVICEYLDYRVGGSVLFPAPGPARWSAMLWHALANGMLDQLILWRNERDKEPQHRLEAWLSAFAEKTRLSLDRLETYAPAVAATPYGIGHIGIGCCLSYVDFRFDALDWRRGRPALAALHDAFESRPSAIATAIVDG